MVVLRGSKESDWETALVEATGLSSTFKVVNTASITAEMVSFSLGVIAEDCDSSEAGTSIRDWRDSSSESVSIGNGSKATKADKMESLWKAAMKCTSVKVYARNG